MSACSCRSNMLFIKEVGEYLDVIRQPIVRWDAVCCLCAPFGWIEKGHLPPLFLLQIKHESAIIKN